MGRPLRELAEATRQISAGEMSVRTGLRGANELGELGRDFDQMADRIQEMTEELSRQVAEAEAHYQMVLELSAPVSALQDRVLFVQIIGELDEARMDTISARTLDGVAEHQAAVVLVDVTGVAHLDAEGAEHLGKLVQAIRLLGAHPILTGFTPDVATTVVQEGLELSFAETTRSVADGLQRAARALDHRV